MLLENSLENDDLVRENIDRNKNKFIYIYCGGKCGSSTLAKTFECNGYNSFVTHDNYFYTKYQRTSNNSPLTIFNAIEESCNKYDNIYFVDSYRTPIERKISAFFQNIAFFIPDYNELPVQSLINYFNTNVLVSWENQHSIDEILVHFNIPLFKEFDFEKGYNIVNQKCSNGTNKIFIKLLFKDIKSWDKILTEIMGENIIMHNENLSENKSIHKLYTEFIKQYKVPKYYLDNFVICDEHFKIYTSKNEKEKYINHWTNNSF